MQKIFLLGKKVIQKEKKSNHNYKHRFTCSRPLAIILLYIFQHVKKLFEQTILRNAVSFCLSPTLLMHDTSQILVIHRSYVVKEKIKITE